MPKLESVHFRTAFGSYHADSTIGQGGAGTVFGATDDTGRQVAIKVLDPTKASTDRLKRFKNEYLFGFHNVHSHLLRVLDFGVVDLSGSLAPFYVMPRYAGSLRTLMQKGLEPDAALIAFSRVLSGVEAAHLLKVVHRDLKPENILANSVEDLVVGDFGIARFEENELLTAVETKRGDRLANFAYASPEQRKKGSSVDQRADIFSLGLILNELFTGEVPQGTEFRAVASAQPAFAWVDEVVAELIRFDPASRPDSVAAVRELLRLRSNLFEERQKVSALTGAVAPADESEDPLELEPPRIVGADYDGRQLVLTFDRPISEGWIDGLRNMGSYSSAWGAGPERFTFAGAQARVASDGHNAQQIINHFKEWLPRATAMYRYRANAARQRAAQMRAEALQRQRAEAERRERIRSSLSI